MNLKRTWLVPMLGLILLSGCISTKTVEPPRFCPVYNLLNEDGTTNTQYYAVERVCLQALQKRLDAAYGEVK